MIYTKEVENMCPVAKLVCTTAGCLQAFIERKERCNRRGIS